MQFHPTVLWTGPDAAGQQALVTEAVRGEGAVLVDGAGRRVMAGVHPLADLAPRDVVAAAIAAHGCGAGRVDDHVFLDATAPGRRLPARRFPAITAACRAVGIDPAREPIPVAPAAHYACGGVPADLDGRTAVAGPVRRRRGRLHRRARRQPAGVELASPRALVAARRCAALLAVGAARAARSRCRPRRATARSTRPPGRRSPRRRPATPACSATAPGLAAADRRARRRPPARSTARWTCAAVEATALHTVATLLAAAAAARTESRGCHRRTDSPDARPEWQVRLVHRLDDAGRAARPAREPVRTLVVA